MINVKQKISIEGLIGKDRKSYNENMGRASYYARHNVPYLKPVEKRLGKRNLLQRIGLPLALIGGIGAGFSGCATTSYSNTHKVAEALGVYDPSFVEFLPEGYRTTIFGADTLREAARIINDDPNKSHQDMVLELCKRADTESPRKVVTDSEIKSLVDELNSSRK